VISQARVAAAAMVALGVALAVAVTPPGSAAAAPWNDALACRIVPAEEDRAAGLISPLADPALRELREYGGGGKSDGRGIRGYVSFTFDDGPSHLTTPAVVRTLLAYDVPATFFVVGHRILEERGEDLRNREALRQLIAAGFHVGNHTVNHRRLTTLPASDLRAEIDANAALIAAVAPDAGWEPRLFRPPYGAMSARVRHHVRDAGYTEVRWSIDERDFIHGSVRSLRRRVGADIRQRGGGVVLLHDTKEETAEALAGILDDLEADNCRHLAAGTALIVPVSIHYFLREIDGARRPVPSEIEAVTARYLAALPARCAARGGVR
jgi:peptidoglycan/xylan/chitin deacetylase (PgdA/CDA1 family)